MPNIFQNCYLFLIFQRLYICSISILIELLIDLGQVSKELRDFDVNVNDAMFIRGPRLLEPRRSM